MFQIHYYTILYYITYVINFILQFANINLLHIFLVFSPNRVYWDRRTDWNHFCEIDQSSERPIGCRKPVNVRVAGGASVAEIGHRRFAASGKVQKGGHSTERDVIEWNVSRELQ